MPIRHLLALESSCDETAVAILQIPDAPEEPPHLLANCVASQIQLHARYGGVVPEIASRAHLERALPLIEEALATAKIEHAQIDAIAVTYGPGLSGALLMGIQIAKAIAYIWECPLIGVNHHAGHLEAIFLEEAPPPRFPFVALLVSGGHTTLYRVDGHELYRHLGGTRDDAAGEAFDKAAKMLGLGYPGGVQIDRLAQQGDPQRFPFPRAMRGKGLDLSFSGLKTAARTTLDALPNPLPPRDLADFCASFQEAIVDALWEKAYAALQQEACTQLLVTGGVAANSRLRALFNERAQLHKLDLFLPSKRFCTDNAAMIAAAAIPALREGRYHDLSLNAEPRLPLDPTTQHRRGKPLAPKHRPHPKGLPNVS